MSISDKLRASLKRDLARVPLFSELSNPAMDQLVEAGSVVEFVPGERVFQQGHPGDSMYVLLSGQLRIYHEGSRRAIVIRKKGEFVGEIALLDGGLRTASGRAVRRCRAFRLTRDQLHSLLAQQPSIALDLLRTINGRARSALERERTLVDKLKAQNIQLESFNQRLAKRVEQKTRELRRANEQLREINKRDPLTSTHNRGYFQQTLEDWLKSQAHLSLILLDIDHFKQLNDTHGHQAGDRVLIQLAGLLEGMAGRGQFAARYGGEEFAFVLSRTQAKTAWRRAEEIRQQILGQKFPLRDGRAGDVTASLGVASYPCHAQDLESLIKAADVALYHSKASGRNRVTLWTPELTGEHDGR